MVNDITTNDLERLTSEIWTTMLDLELTPDKMPCEPTPKISACVQILGKWEGAVRLDLALDLARRAAAAFTGAEPDDVTHEQVLDAAGELANMTAGGLKTMLPKPCRLSLPSVVEGVKFVHTVRNGRPVLDSGFSTSSGSLVVTVFESSVAAPAQS